MHPIWDFTATHWKHLVNLHWFIAPYYSQTSLYQVYKLRESLGFSTSFFKNWILLLKQSSWPFFSFSCYFFIFSLTSVYMLSCSVYSFFLAKKKTNYLTSWLWNSFQAIQYLFSSKISLWPLPGNWFLLGLKYTYTHTWFDTFDWLGSSCVWFTAFLPSGISRKNFAECLDWKERDSFIEQL